MQCKLVSSRGNENFSLLRFRHWHNKSNNAFQSYVNKHTCSNILQELPFKAVSCCAKVPLAGTRNGLMTPSSQSLRKKLWIDIKLSSATQSVFFLFSNNKNCLLFILLPAVKTA